MLSVSPFFMLILLNWIFFVSISKFIMSWGHVLISILSLEILAMIMFTNFVGLLQKSYELYSGLFLISVLVCGLSLGLSILTSLIRSFGSEFSKGMNILKW